MRAAFITSPVFASTPPTIYDQTVSYKHADQVAHYFLRASVKWLPVQNNWLADTNNVVATLDHLQGKRASNTDTVTYIQDVEATYQGLVAEARTNSANANYLVATHPGFDANGIVTDLTTAGTTVQQFKTDLDHALPLLRAAWEEVHKVMWGPLETGWPGHPGDHNAAARPGDAQASFERLRRADDIIDHIHSAHQPGLPITWGIDLLLGETNPLLD